MLITDENSTVILIHQSLLQSVSVIYGNCILQVSTHVYYKWVHMYTSF